MGGSLLIFVADEDLCITLGDLLEAQGFDCRTATTPSEAASALRATPSIARAILD